MISTYWTQKWRCYGITRTLGDRCNWNIQTRTFPNTNSSSKHCTTHIIISSRNTNKFSAHVTSFWIQLVFVLDVLVSEDSAWVLAINNSGDSSYQLFTGNRWQIPVSQSPDKKRPWRGDQPITSCTLYVNKPQHNYATCGAQLWGKQCQHKYSTTHRHVPPVMYCNNQSIFIGLI